MVEKTKIPVPGLDGKMHTATKVDVEKSVERWSNITLADGTELKIKPVVIEADRFDDLYDADDHPLYSVKNQVFISIVSTPNNLKRRK